MTDYALQALGLGAEAELVYRAMLAEPALGVTGLAERLSLTESDVRSGLDELVRLTLIRESRDAPGQMRAVRPEVGLDLIIRRQEEDLARRQQELAASRARVAETVAEFSVLRPTAPSGESQRLTGLDAINAQLELLAKGTTSSCYSVMPGGAQSPASMNASRVLDEDALTRGVEVLTLYQDSARNDAATHAYARWLTKLNGEVRTAPVLPPRMLIFDRVTAVIPIDPANTRLGALCTSEVAIVASLIAVFELAWETAVPLGTDMAVAEAQEVTAVERELLRLLARGLTDEAVGHKLGTSARTVRRQVAALMERLGASSRFETGLKAAQLGWLQHRADARGPRDTNLRGLSRASGGRQREERHGDFPTVINVTPQLLWRLPGSCGRVTANRLCGTQAGRAERAGLVPLPYVIPPGEMRHGETSHRTRTR
jgi:DNA-binding CsgD family transcriptional regulator/sugar-specific transcriptional regulator TrmB